MASNKYLNLTGLNTLWAKIKAKITSAIQALDVSSVGGDGKYISAISETDGKISATATTMDTAPTANSTKAVTSGGVKTALDNKADKVSITGATKCKVTYNSQGIVTSGADLAASDIPNLSESKITTKYDKRFNSQAASIIGRYVHICTVRQTENLYGVATFLMSDRFWNYQHDTTDIITVSLADSGGQNTSGQVYVKRVNLSRSETLVKYYYVVKHPASQDISVELWKFSSAGNATGDLSVKLLNLSRSTNTWGSTVQETAPENAVEVPYGGITEVAFKDSSGNTISATYFKSSGNVTLASGTATKIGTQNGTDVKLTLPTIPAATATTPKMDGTAAVGSETTWAKGDHVHPSDTSRVPTTRKVNGHTLSSDVTVTAADISAVRYDTNAQGLTDTQKGNARTNIGAGTSNLALGTTSTTAAKGDHTHTTSIASDSSSGTVVTLAHNTQYKLTAGGTSVIFKTPTDSNTDTKVTQTKDDSGTTAYPLLMAGATDPNGSATTARYDSGVKLTPSTNTISANISGNAATATTATNASITRTADTTNGDKLQIGTGTAVNITNAKHAASADSATSATNYASSGGIATALSGKVPKTVVTSLADWNTLNETGIYAVESQASNVAHSPESGKLACYVTVAAGYVTQLVVGDKVYKRCMPAGTQVWEDWVVLQDSNDTAIPASANDKLKYVTHLLVNGNKTLALSEMIEGKAYVFHVVSSGAVVRVYNDSSSAYTIKHRGTNVPVAASSSASLNSSTDPAGEIWLARVGTNIYMSKSCEAGTVQDSLKWNGYSLSLGGTPTAGSGTIYFT